MTNGLDRRQQSMRAWREERRMSRLQLATLLGVDPQTIYRWESGRRLPSRPTLIALASVLAVPISAILPPTRRELAQAAGDSP